MSEDCRGYVDMRLAHQRELMGRELELRDKALQIQAREYERRLDVLNHAHEQAVAEQARVLPRETFDLFLKEYSAFKLDTRENLAAMASRAAAWTAAIGLGFLILNVVLIMWHR